MSDEVTQQTAESLAGRSVSREHYDWMVQNRNEWQQKAEALGGAAQRLTVENEGLRADALAYPPQRLDVHQYASLKADFERQEIVIETLQEALKRTEARLAKAQAQDIDPRLKGFLATISQLADQSQDMIP